LFVSESSSAVGGLKRGSSGLKQDPDSSKRHKHDHTTN